MKRGPKKGMSRKNSKSYGTLGFLVRRARLEQRLGLADVAKCCHCSVQFISNIEHGRAPLPWSKVSDLANLLKISINELQTANIAIRSNFSGIANSPMKKARKNEILKNLSDITLSMNLISSNSSLQEIFKRYKNATDHSKNQFIEAALGLLPL